MTLVAIYLLIGAALTLRHGLDIAASSPDPEDPVSLVCTAVRWIITWPFWVRESLNN